MRLSTKTLSFVILLQFCFNCSCNLKSKTELYLERGLDILDNTKEFENDSANSFGILKIGVIRDQSQNKRDLIIQLKDTLVNPLRIQAIKGFGSNNMIQEYWDIEPKVINIKKYNYLVYEINTSIEDKVDTLKIYFHKSQINEKSDTLVLNNLQLNND